MSNCEAMREKGLELPEHLHHGIVMCSRDAISGHTPKELKTWSWRNICLFMFTTALLTESQNKSKPDIPAYHGVFKTLIMVEILNSLFLFTIPQTK
jgi:hypothetical protein